MANKENKKGNNQAPTAPVDNAEELTKVLNNQGLTDEQSESIREIIAKESDENLKRQARVRFEKAIYRIEQAVLQRKRDRRISDDCSLYKTRQMTRMARFLAGGVVDDPTLEYAQTPDDIWGRETLDKKNETITLVIDVKSGEKKTFKKGEKLPAIIDSVDFDKMYDQLDSKLREIRKEIDEEYDTLLKKLDLRHGEYWDRSWRW